MAQKMATVSILGGTENSSACLEWRMGASRGIKKRVGRGKQR